MRTKYLIIFFIVFYLYILITMIFLQYCTKGNFSRSIGDSERHVVALNTMCGHAVAVSAATGSKGDFLKVKLGDGEGIQTDAGGSI